MYLSTWQYTVVTNTCTSLTLCFPQYCVTRQSLPSLWGPLWLKTEAASLCKTPCSCSFIQWKSCWPGGEWWGSSQLSPWWEDRMGLASGPQLHSHWEFFLNFLLVYIMAMHNGMARDQNNQWLVYTVPVKSLSKSSNSVGFLYSYYLKDTTLRGKKFH